jgi:hypothetical protein
MDSGSAREAVRALFFALMNLIGGASVALGVLSLYVIALPLRRGVPGAAAILVLVNAIAFFMAAVTAESLPPRPAHQPHIMGFVFAVTCLAFLLHVVGQQRRHT